MGHMSLGTSTFINWKNNKGVHHLPIPSLSLQVCALHCYTLPHCGSGVEFGAQDRQRILGIKLGTSDFFHPPQILYASEASKAAAERAQVDPQDTRWKPPFTPGSSAYENHMKTQWTRWISFMRKFRNNLQATGLSDLFICRRASMAHWHGTSGMCSRRDVAAPTLLSGCTVF